MLRTVKAQFNVRIPMGLARKMRQEAARSGRPLDAITETIFEDFLSAWTSRERDRSYERLRKKRNGRPLKTEALA